MLAIIFAASALALPGYAPLDEGEGPFAGLEKQVRDKFGQFLPKGW